MSVDESDQLMRQSRQLKQRNRYHFLVIIVIASRTDETSGGGDDAATNMEVTI
jgi:hypothetical protein